MGTQGYRSNYREAFECANQQLGAIYSEYHDLQSRKEQLECAVAALGPFLKSVRNPVREEVFMPEPARVEPVWEEPALRSIIASEPLMPASVAPEQVVAPSYAPVSDYAPVSEANVDPIQARINRALGLAVA